MKEVTIEFFCPRCAETWFQDEREEERKDRCPICGHKGCQSRFIVCDCGTTVYLESNTNECDGCGRLYNLFGQSLRPIEEWDEEDHEGGY